jgi:hypothetical protein
MTFLDHGTGGVFRYKFEDGSTEKIASVTPFGGVFTGTAFGMTAVSDAARGELLVLKNGAMVPLATGFAGKSRPPRIGPTGLAFVRWFDEPDYRSALYVGDGDSIWRIRSTDTAPPVVRDVRMEPNPRAVGQPGKIAGTIDDSQTGGSVIDRLCPVGLIPDPSPEGMGVHCDISYSAVPRVPAGLVLDEPIEEVSFDIGGTALGEDGPGVYRILLGGYDAAGNLAWEPAGTSAQAIVYDPAAGALKARGWLDSPPGAVTSRPSAVGRLSFTFEARYESGRPQPTGSIDIQFKAGGISCRADLLRWLIIRGNTALLQGVGTGCKVLLSSVDGQIAGGDGLDRIRVQIRGVDDSLAYDSHRGQPDFSAATDAIAGGSISIQPIKPAK